MTKLIINKEERTLLVPCKLAYPALFRPKKDKYGKESWSTTLLLDRTTEESKDVIRGLRQHWYDNYLPHVGAETKEDLTDSQAKTYPIKDGPKYREERIKKLKQKAREENKTFEEPTDPLDLLNLYSTHNVWTVRKNKREGMTDKEHPTVMDSAGRELAPLNAGKKLYSGVDAVVLLNYYLLDAKDEILPRVCYNLVAVCVQDTGIKIAGGSGGGEMSKEDIGKTFKPFLHASSAAIDSGDAGGFDSLDDDDL